MPITRRQLASILAGAGFVLPVAGWPRVSRAATLTAPTLEELYQKPDRMDAALSPDGSRVAVLRIKRDSPEFSWEGERHTAYVALHASNNLEARPALVGVGRYEVEQIEWANNERLLIWVRKAKHPDGTPVGLRVGSRFYPMPERRVLAVNPDGSNPVVLFGTRASLSFLDFNLGNVVDRLPKDEHFILMQRWVLEHTCFGLYKVDVRDGQATLIELGEKATDGWFVQDGQAVLRFDSNSRQTSFSVFGRAPGQTEWRLIRKTRRTELKRFARFDVVGVTPKPGVILISHRTDSEEFASIKEFDLRTLAIGEVLKSIDGADADDVVMDEAERLVGVGFKRDLQDYVFENPSLAENYKALAKRYEGEANIRLYDVSLDHRHFIFHVIGPRLPGQFVYYDVDSQRMHPLGDQFEHLTKDRLARMEVLDVTTRDGAKITAYLSHPINANKPAPMVVMPHGGPEARDHYDYHPWVQALCARGWLVLQPNFRGSGGYGRSFGDAGRKQWGDRMQADVEDAVAQVVASGAADPKRLAIMGASYGGYAAMMGVVRQPRLYRCAVAIAGDFDLIKSLEISRREDGVDSESYAYWMASMGDPRTDAALLKSHSPRYRAAEIQAPVMMIHGAEDKVVSPLQSREMAKTLKKAGKVYEHIELDGEGHNGWSEANSIRVLRACIRFISAAFDAE
ncbi:MAG TPA: alpha/beta fold hydrolase [Caulobacter sp.]|nr:alpha/beta fold hydrolase [Caulobacter sp.]